MPAPEQSSGLAHQVPGLLPSPLTVYGDIFKLPCLQYLVTYPHQASESPVQLRLLEAAAVRGRLGEDHSAPDGSRLEISQIAEKHRTAYSLLSIINSDTYRDPPITTLPLGCQCHKATVKASAQIILSPKGVIEHMVTVFEKFALDSLRQSLTNPRNAKQTHYSSLAVHEQRLKTISPTALRRDLGSLSGKRVRIEMRQDRALADIPSPLLN